VLYTDAEDVKMRNQRIKETKWNHILQMIFYLGGVMLCIAGIYLNRGHRSLQNFFIITLPLYSILGGITSYYLIRRTNQMTLHGVILTSSHLDWYGKKIPISSILYTEVVDFVGGGRFIVLMLRKKRKNKIKILKGDETADPLKLSNMIRRLKGFSRQEKIKTWRHNNLAMWKKQTLQMLSRLKEVP